MPGPADEQQQHEKNGQVARQVKQEVAGLFGTALIVAADFQPVENKANDESSQRQRTQGAHFAQNLSVKIVRTQLVAGEEIERTWPMSNDGAAQPRPAAL